MRLVFAWTAREVDHIDEHRVTTEEAEYVVRAARKPFPQKRPDGKWVVWGQTEAGRYLQVIFVFPPDNFAADSRDERGVIMKTARPGKMRMQGRTNRRAPTARAEIVKAGDMQPLSPEEQRMWDALDRTPRPPGRPKIGQGAKNVLISLELGLLERADTFARGHRIGRSQLIAKAIERYLRDALEIESDFHFVPASAGA